MNDGPRQEAVLALMTMTCLTFPTTIGTLPRSTAALPATPQTNEAPTPCTCNSGTAGPLGCHQHQGQEREGAGT